MTKDPKQLELPLGDQSGVAEVLAQRGSKYGPFKYQGALAQALKQTMRQGLSWEELPPEQREALDMIAHKISRVVSGEVGYLDSWVDIAGYAQLVVNGLQQGD